MLNESPQSAFVPPGGERPELLLERTRQKRITHQTACPCQLPDHLRCVKEKGQHSPVTFEWKKRKKDDEIVIGVRGAKCSPRTCGHDFQLYLANSLVDSK